MPTTTYPHIEIRDGMAYVAGTRMKVVTLVLEHLANHWEAEALRRQHPPLSLGQVHSALAYYYDHQVELDQIISAGLRAGLPVEEIMKEVDQRQSRAQANGRPGPSQVERA